MTLAREIALKHFGPAYTQPELQALEDAIRTERERCIIQLSSDDAERFRCRVALERLIAEIRPNLGTHDHTDWELRRMVDRAEDALNDE